MKIKNSHSRKRKTTKDRIFENYQRLRKNIRLKTSKIIPLSINEDLLYNDRVSKMRNTKIDKNRYFELNGQIYILHTYPKAKISNLYVELNELIRKNPVTKKIISTVMEKDLKSAVFQFAAADNIGRYCQHFEITPKHKELDTIVDFISITMFELSNDFIGISFEVNLSDECKNEINNLIISDCEGEEEYIKYYSKNKTLVTKTSWNPDITRKKIINDYIIEIKSRTIDFITKYIDLSKNETKPPISIDVYTTNYDLKENNRFLHTYDIFKDDKTNDNISVVYRYQEESDKFIDSEFIFECGENSQEINRSARLIIIKKDEFQEMFIPQYELINFFIITLYFYNIGEFSRELSIIRNNLYKFYSKKESKIYSEYDKSIKEIQKYKMMFNNVKLSKDFYIYKYLEDSLQFQNKRYEELLKSYEQLEISYNNKMLVTNYKSTLWLAKVSLFIAIVSIFITIGLTYLKDPNIENIDNNIELQLEAIKKQNNKIDSINDKIEYFINKNSEF